jgi:hypothetical protein
MYRCRSMYRSPSVTSIAVDLHFCNTTILSMSLLSLCPGAIVPDWQAAA